MQGEKLLLQAEGMKLLEWYHRVKRELPWRKTKEPYPIWISEVMLQQTRVETVIPYYERFLQAFPTPESLAAATEEEVVAVWQGLGYYSRARNLQGGVQEWLAEYGKELPKERKDLEKIRGIGPYTAGALLSIVYNLPEAAVDGNVFRVITRYREIADEIQQSKTREKVAEIVLQMMPAEEAGNFNQALMELGASLCSPTSPRCSFCPLSASCGSYHQGTMLEYPKKKAPKPPKPVHVFGGVLFSEEGKVLLRKRKSRGLLAGMWEFPSVEVSREAEGPERLRNLFDQEGLDVEITEFVCGVEHIFSHRKWNLAAYKIQLKRGGALIPEEWSWHPWGNPEDILWAGPHRKVADYLLNLEGESTRKNGEEKE